LDSIRLRRIGVPTVSADATARYERGCPPSCSVWFGHRPACSCPASHASSQCDPPGAPSIPWPPSVAARGWPLDEVPCPWIDAGHPTRHRE